MSALACTACRRRAYHAGRSQGVWRGARCEGQLQQIGKAEGVRRRPVSWSPATTEAASQGAHISMHGHNTVTRQTTWSVQLQEPAGDGVQQCDRLCTTSLWDKARSADQQQSQAHTLLRGAHRSAHSDRAAAAESATSARGSCRPATESSPSRGPQRLAGGSSCSCSCMEARLRLRHEVPHTPLDGQQAASTSPRQGDNHLWVHGKPFLGSMGTAGLQKQPACAQPARAVTGLGACSCHSTWSLM